MLGVSALLVLLASYGVRSEPSKSRCLKTFQELEKSLLARSANADSLRDAFYPPNRQTGIVVNVFYYFDDGTIYDEQNVTYNYAFRWATSAVLQFIRPELLQHLSLYTYHGHTTTLNITIDPVCANRPLQHRDFDEVACSGERNSSDAALMLNTLTVHVSSHICAWNSGPSLIQREVVLILFQILRKSMNYYYQDIVG